MERGALYSKGGRQAGMSYSDLQAQFEEIIKETFSAATKTAAARCADHVVRSGVCSGQEDRRFPSSASFHGPLTTRTQMAPPMPQGASADGAWRRGFYTPEVLDPRFGFAALDGDLPPLGDGVTLDFNNILRHARRIKEKCEGMCNEQFTSRLPSREASRRASRQGSLQPSAQGSFVAPPREGLASGTGSEALPTANQMTFASGVRGSPDQKADPSRILDIAGKIMKRVHAALKGEGEGSTSLPLTGSEKLPLSSRSGRRRPSDYRQTGWSTILPAMPVGTTASAQNEARTRLPESLAWPSSTQAAPQPQANIGSGGSASLRNATTRGDGNPLVARSAELSRALADIAAWTPTSASPKLTKATTTSPTTAKDSSWDNMAAALGLGGEGAKAPRDQLLLSRASLRRDQEFGSIGRVDGPRWEISCQSGAYSLAAGMSVLEGKYKWQEETASVVDEATGQVIGRFTSDIVSRYNLLIDYASPATQDLPCMDIVESEIVEEIQRGCNEGAFFVLPSQLNGAEYPSSQHIVRSIEEYKNDKSGGARGQLAVHPGVGQFMLDNAACEERPAGISAVDMVLEQTRVYGFKMVNGYLEVPKTSEKEKEERALRHFRNQVHLLRPLIMEDVPACGLTPETGALSSASHKVSVVYASTVPVQCDLNEGGSVDFQVGVAEAILVSQYHGALKTAAARTTEGKRKVFLSPVGVLGGGALNNPLETVVKAMALAVEMLTRRDREKLDIKVVAWSGAPSSKDHLQALLLKHKKLVRGTAKDSSHEQPTAATWDNLMRGMSLPAAQLPAPRPPSLSHPTSP